MSRRHASSVVEPSARVSEDARVEANVVVGADVEVEGNTRLRAGTVLTGPLVCGPDNDIGPLASLGSDPQDLKYEGERTRATVGRGNRIREFATLNRGTEGGGGLTSLGDDNLLMAYAHVAHDCRVGSGIVMANAATLGGHVTVEDASVVGAFTSIHPFCRVGTFAYLGGYCVITRDVPPYVRVVGQRDEARTIGINSIGLSRRGVPEETIVALKRAYRIYRRDGRLEQILDDMAGEYGDVEEVRRFVDFCRDSERGLIR